MKKLEDFIRNNRDAFDSDTPGDKVWQKLNNELTGKGKRNVVRINVIWLKWSAVAAAIIIAVLMIFNPREVTKDQQTATAQTELPGEYAQEVNQVTRLIALKYKELDKIRNEEPTLYNKFSADIKKLDSNYQELKNNLAGNPNESLLLEAMIQNLNLQLNLLNEQLSIINKIKQHKKSRNDKAYKST